MFFRNFIFFFQDVCLQAIQGDLVVAVVAPGEDKRVAENDARR
jgi:hypothetical protein